jgi:hypothetical protein
MESMRARSRDDRRAYPMDIVCTEDDDADEECGEEERLTL